MIRNCSYLLLFTYLQWSLYFYLFKFSNVLSFFRLFASSSCLPFLLSLNCSLVQIRIFVSSFMFLNHVKDLLELLCFTGLSSEFSIKIDFGILYSMFLTWWNNFPYFVFTLWCVQLLLWKKQKTKCFIVSYTSLVSYTEVVVYLILLLNF